MTNLISLLCIGILLATVLPAILYPTPSNARCPNGYHKSPSGDCEKVPHSRGLPRCTDGYHHIPDGDCERVSSGDGDNGKSSESADNDHVANDNDNERTEEQSDGFEGGDSGDIGETSSFSSEDQKSHYADCEGSADCFRGIVTETSTTFNGKYP
jgi:hypothetical protein